LGETMRMSKTTAELIQWGEDNAEQVASLPSDWEEIMQARYQEFLDELRSNPQTKKVA